MFWLKKIILQIDFISRKLIVLKYNRLTHIQNHDMNKLCFCENNKSEMYGGLTASVLISGSSGSGWSHGQGQNTYMYMYR